MTPDPEGRPVGLFRPYERKTTTEQERPHKRTRLVPDAKPQRAPRTSSTSTSPATPTESEARTAPSRTKVTRRQPVRKTEPTLTRKQAEAARMERLHPNLSPAEQRKANREARAKARFEAWDKIEASPERVLARDFVDTRWTITEFMLPLMLVAMAGMIFTITDAMVSFIISIVLWVLLFLSLINTWVMWRSFKKVLAQRVPNAITRGLMMYMFNRSLMIRRFRRPGPRINRGDAI
ncbi:DUF3043 domain-containing protein [Arachnia propionica]|uniref:DUF3043 domain-containing protein n=1 Tax=Arachnia propionica TaxID=1750 RepID=A0A3P1TAZ2_9ACTN|nr:DUF3043 domain-containing protein [Arachnia propionica]RRD06607.1 DUF3043 domain-containing protein [Arachnia propionica]